MNEKEPTLKQYADNFVNEVVKGGTELTLQLWLAKQLPEEIEFCPKGTLKPNPFHGDSEEPIHSDMFWWKGEEYVTPREWDYIVRRVEEKLTLENGEVGQYLYELEKTLVISGSHARNKAQNFKFITAPWQTRTIALMKLIP